MFKPFKALQPFHKGRVPFGTTDIQRAISILRRFGTDAHIFMPGLGNFNGLQFANYIDSIVAFVNMVTGGDVWDPSIRGIYALPAKLQFGDVMSAVVLSLGLSFIVTIFPARRAARMNPVEALRYE